MGMLSMPMLPVGGGLKSRAERERERAAKAASGESEGAEEKPAADNVRAAPMMGMAGFDPSKVALRKTRPQGMRAPAGLLQSQAQSCMVLPIPGATPMPGMAADGMCVRDIFYKFTLSYPVIFHMH